MKHLFEYINKSIGKLVYYNVEKDIPIADLEDIIKEIEKQGFGVAISSGEMYDWIAREWAMHKGDTNPNLARLECTYEKRAKLYIPHCSKVDEILHKYFKFYIGSAGDFWYRKSTPLKQVKTWLDD